MAEGQKKGRLKDPELRRIRFMHFLNDKLVGMSNEQIAEKWNVERKTVVRTLSWGKRNGIIADAEDDLLQELFPRAQKVILDALEEGDVGVAMKIYDKVVKGRDAKKGDGGAHDEDELARYMAERRRRQEELENTTEGELIGDSIVAGLLTDSAGDAPDEDGDPAGPAPASE